jgi:hypothetical protein
MPPFIQRLLLTDHLNEHRMLVGPVHRDAPSSLKQNNTIRLRVPNYFEPNDGFPSGTVRRVYQKSTVYISEN